MYGNLTNIETSADSMPEISDATLPSLMPLQAWATGLKASVCVWLYFWIRSTID